MEENENEVTNSTQEYIKYCSSLFNILNSETLYLDDQECKIKTID
jgi:hypothetical protein